MAIVNKMLVPVPMGKVGECGRWNAGRLQHLAGEAFLGDQKE